MLRTNLARTVVCAAVLLLYADNALADVTLPRLVGDNMVLQRDSKLTPWGWALPGERVTIDFHGKRFTVKTDLHGQWLTSIGPFSAGGPYDMTVRGKNTIRLHNILLGDVWLASGQSNMEFPMKASGEWRRGVNNADVEIARAHFPQIRLFIVKHDAALKPVFDVNSDGWRAVTPDTVGEFSAVAYLFGRELHERYHVPIGLIESSWGGTVAEAWMSEPALRGFPGFRSAIDAIASVTDRTRDAYEQYRNQWEVWRREHGQDDRGRVDGRDAWAAPDLDMRHWQAIKVPRPIEAWGKDFDGFDGVVWFRRAVTLSPDKEGRELLLQLGDLAKDDTTYFNGERIGETAGIKAREYVVPGRLVHAGQNVITVRLVGAHEPEDPTGSGVGMFGPEAKMNAEIGISTMSLAGTWFYQPGPDLQEYPVADSTITAAQPNSNTPTELFNAMISPLLNVRLKGVIWYQGESNAIDNRAAQYRTLFPALVKDWREHWGYQLPFLFVQLAGFGREEPESAECQWAELREAQAMALSLPATGMATAVDIGEADDIHPKNKQDVAHRLVLAARKVVYGEDILSTGPTYQSSQVEGNQIRVTFSNLGGGLRIKDKYGYLRGFEVAGEDRKFTWAKARQDGSDILVFNDDIRHPIAVRYDWANTPDGNVYNSEGLPTMPFRADVTAN